MMNDNDLVKHLKLSSLMEGEHTTLKKFGLPVIKIGAYHYTFGYLVDFWQKFSLYKQAHGYVRDWEIVSLVYKNEDTRRILVTLLGLLTHQEFIIGGAFVIFEKLGIEKELSDHPDAYLYKEQ